MYHYLKWAALSLFLKRNLRYLLLIAVGIVGIYVADALYQDMARYAALAGKSGDIAGYLLMKWAAVLLFTALILYSILRLGISKERRVKERMKRDSRSAEAVGPEDPYLKRMERFKTEEALRSRSQIVLEKRKRDKKEG
ncbi:hypothetical protein [Hydrogenimonas sp.]